MAKNTSGYLSARESRKISRENRKITNQFEKKRKRKELAEARLPHGAKLESASGQVDAH